MLITREMLSKDEVEFEDGVTVIVTPKGKSTITHLRKLATQWLYGAHGMKQRFPHDEKYNEYSLGINGFKK